MEAARLFDRNVGATQRLWNSDSCLRLRPRIDKARRPFLAKKLQLPARMENLRSFVELIGGFAAQEGLSSEKTLELELAVEEALVNVFNYAYPDGEGDVEVSCSTDRSGKTIVVEIIDRGKSFDPLNAPPPDLTPVMEKRRIGGLGILLIGQLADEVRYSREGDRNILSIRIAVDRDKR